MRPTGAHSTARNLDRGLNNGEAVAGSAEIIAGWDRRSAELPLLRKQTTDFAGHRARYGLPVRYEEIPGADHFSIMDEMASPRGRITTLIRQLFDRSI